MRTGLVIGKFFPLTAGHQYLIETALQGCDVLYIIVCSSHSQFIPGNVRVEWIKQLYPQAQVLETDCYPDDDDQDAWVENTVRWMGCYPHIVFSSEDYGPGYAAKLGAKHVMVDRKRTAVPISGTLVRNDPVRYWDYLAPCVQQWFAKELLCFG